MSKSKNAQTDPPNLNKLKGSYIIDKDLRDTLQLDPNILTGSAKTWQKAKLIVDDYFERCETWLEQPQQFVSLLRKTLHKIILHLEKQSVNDLSNVELLLKQYCSSLEKFYCQTGVVQDLMSYYEKKELQKRAQDNLLQVHTQSEATASVLVIEKSRTLERLSKKRTLDDMEKGICDNVAVEYKIFPFFFSIAYFYMCS